MKFFNWNVISLCDSLPKPLPPKIEEEVSLVLREFLSTLQEGTSASGCKWLGGDTSAGRKGRLLM